MRLSVNTRMLQEENSQNSYHKLKKLVLQFIFIFGFHRGKFECDKFDCEYFAYSPIKCQAIVTFLLAIVTNFVMKILPDTVIYLER